MDTLRIARDFGTVSVLFPDGIESLHDLPYPLHQAIATGMVYLKFEELPKDEAPPRKIWLDNDKLSAHFTRVERDRERKYGGGGGGSGEDEQQNPAAQSLLVE